MSAEHGKLDPAILRRRFDLAADSFGRADFVYGHVRDGLLERIAPIVVDADFVLDLGCGPGAGSRMLAKRFRKGRIIGLDWSMRMLARCKKDRPWFSKRSELQGDALHLPFRAGSIDVIFANLLLPWIDDLPTCLGEVARVLRKDGLFAFSTLGPDSFRELRAAWRTVDDSPHVREFADMHDTGDALVRSGLRDPVLDVDHLRVSYTDPETLLRDLRNAGAGNSLAGRRATLTGRARLEGFREKLFAAPDGSPLHVTFELVYGHAWGGGVVPDAGEFHVDPAAIRRRSRPAG